MTAPPLPTRAKSFSDVPDRHEVLYEDDDENGGYKLTPAGALLSRAREAVNGHTGPWPANPPLPKTAATVSRSDWINAISIATPDERRHLLKACGAGAIRVKG